jgi:predicted nucleic acid-binding protein
MPVLLDTGILIDVLRGKREAVAYLEHLDEPASVSVISVTEVEAGLKTRQEGDRARHLTAVLRLRSVDETIARRAGAFVRVYRKSHSVEIADALIAATAEHYELTLATLNVKHFPMFPRLKRAY